MHPNSAFRAEGVDLLDAAEAIGLAHIFALTDDGPMVVQAPVTRHGATLRFHVARGNRITPALDGARVALSLVGVHGYVSPNWYAVPGDQVPTWNYTSVEIDGVARAIDEPALIEQLDRLAAVHEPRDHPWDRAKMDPAAFAGLLRAIRGFAVTVEAARGTIKLSQNRSAADRAGVVAGLTRAGGHALAAAMEPFPPPAGAATSAA